MVKLPYANKDFSARIAIAHLFGQENPTELHAAGIGLSFG